MKSAMLVNGNIVLTVIKHPFKRGYSIRHNQQSGWKGTTADLFGWYKYKSEAVKRAAELINSF